MSSKGFYDETTAIREVAACAIPRLDFSSINDLQAKQDEKAVDYTYALTGLLEEQPRSTEKGGGWLLTPLDQMINATSEVGATTMIRDATIKEKNRHNVITKITNNKPTKLNHS